jgi:hypothetical protein
MEKNDRINLDIDLDMKLEGPKHITKIKNHTDQNRTPPNIERNEWRDNVENTAK